ncbi:hypothetical protein HPP92_018919 [Vanilla planifolia]|uniref:Uncharacterized protein n=1 Tax=Vanilla planifolia TaxID=51239 RepID=A0A835UL71_VANPL|nr:hypothetical protein HPP92_018919 [Vanilla planifolia]
MELCLSHKYCLRSRGGHVEKKRMQEVKRQCLAPCMPHVWTNPWVETGHGGWRARSQAFPSSYSLLSLYAPCFAIMHIRYPHLELHTWKAKLALDNTTLPPFSSTVEKPEVEA